MNLEGLMTVKPEQVEIIEKLARMMGTSFLEEGWSAEYLSVLDSIGEGEGRKLELSQAILRCDFTVSAPYSGVYALPDLSAAAGAYLFSELQGLTWNDLENRAFKLLSTEVLTEQEQVLLEAKADSMAAVSDFTWLNEYREGRDFIHFYAVGVDPEKRGSGSFRKLFTPFLAFADAHNLPCFLECYNDKTEAIYRHFGFDLVKRLTDPAIDLVERCMMRNPSTSVGSAAR